MARRQARVKAEEEEEARGQRRNPAERSHQPGGDLIVTALRMASLCRETGDGIESA